MEGIQTLHEFMYRTESITYVIIIAALIGIAGFFVFLSERDGE